jgi:hypothetical protein
MASTMHTRDGHVAVTGGRIWYRVVGELQATPLAIVHGGPGVTHDYLEPLHHDLQFRAVGASPGTTQSPSGHFGAVALRSELLPGPRCLDA